MAPPNKQGAGKRPTTGALEAVGLRNEFYRDKFRAMATSMPLLVIALLVSLALNVVLATRKPVDRYFAVDGAGRIVPIRSLTEPYVTDAYLSTWVTEKVTSAYSMDPQNYRRQVAALEPYFTPEGYEEFVNSLKSSGTIDQMLQHLLVSTGVPAGAPVVVGRGEANGVFFWKVQLPVLVEYRSSTKSAQKRRIVEVTVVRRQTIESPDGIGIAQFVATDA